MDVTPISLVNLLSQVESKNEAANLFLRQLEEDVALAIQKFKKGAGEAKGLGIDRRRRELEFEVGDQVLLSTRNLPVQVAAGGSKKLGPLYCGPFTVLGEVHGSLQIEITSAHEDSPYLSYLAIEIIQKSQRTRTEPTRNQTQF